MRYFIEFSYDGTQYCGMQSQPNAVSVQEVIENVLSKKLHQNIKIISAGRTDAGVHAYQMFAHFDTLQLIDNKIINSVNSFLPKDISLKTIYKVHENAHARFNAVARTYIYKVSTEKNPFLQYYSYQISHKKIDIFAMNQAAKILLHYSDFSSFSKLHSDNKTNICTITEAYWTEENGLLQFHISADRFLRNMVRAIVGTLLEVGLGKISVTDFEKIIQQKERKFAKTSAPAQGLYLKSVLYPKEIFI